MRKSVFDRHQRQRMQRFSQNATMPRGLLCVTDSDAPSVMQEYRYEVADGGIH